MIQSERVKKINDKPNGKGIVVYWMSRDQRVKDNWALLYAQEMAIMSKFPLVICFTLVPKFLDATLRQYDFMLEGLKKVEQDLAGKNISFYLILGNPVEEIQKFVDKIGAGVLITDFDPLRIKRRWKASLKRKIEISFYEVDAHNIVPVWETSDKKEFAARTIRPRITKLLPKYLVEFPSLKRQSKKYYLAKNNWNTIYKSLEIDRSVESVKWIKSGEKEADKGLKEFIDKKLDGYSKYRNDPSKEFQSNLSPYLHFGQISAQSVAIKVKKAKANQNSKKEFLEEIIIRKELSDNYCYYEKNYDKFSGFHKWAQKTLNEHKKNKRDYLYSRKQLENSMTHDNIWNAAQSEMVKRGKMHGYMRMYWAKKILEWTKSPELALKYAIYLNDKYELDGRDPNGYTGIAWSIGGVHDRAWSERKIFGKIRYMNEAGLKRKFNIAKYVERVNKI